MRPASLALIVLAFAACATQPTPMPPTDEPLEPLPPGVADIEYPSAADNSQQPARVYFPDGDEPVPLLVGLHSWSHDFRQHPHSWIYARFAIENGWAFVHPNFRGPNNNPDAMGSDLVVQDIRSVVEFAKTQRAIDPTRIYLVGVSGGGYASLLMAGRASEIWAGVSAWVPISNINRWYEDTKAAGLKYAGEIVKACGGIPNEDDAAHAECEKRSALTYLEHARDVPVDINAGIHDGHDGASVPVSHSLRAFNALAAESDRLSDEEIAVFTEQQQVPEHLAAQTEADTTYGEKRVLFRRASGNVRITLFEGGHEIVHNAALNWLSNQSKPE